MTARGAGCQATQGSLRSLPHLQVLKVKRKTPATAASAAPLAGLDALEALDAPYLTELDIDVVLPPSEQVTIDPALVKSPSNIPTAAQPRHLLRVHGCHALPGLDALT